MTTAVLNQKQGLSKYGPLCDSVGHTLMKLALQRDFLDSCIPVGSLYLHSHLSLLPGSALFSHNCLNLNLFLIFPTRVQAL